MLLTGISLTVAESSENSFKVSIIPHTQEQTNLRYKEKGDTMNIECDIIGKYIEKLFSKKEEKEITEEFLIKNGFFK